MAYSGSSYGVKKRPDSDVGRSGNIRKDKRPLKTIWIASIYLEDLFGGKVTVMKKHD